MLEVAFFTAGVIACFLFLIFLESLSKHRKEVAKNKKKIEDKVTATKVIVFSILVTYYVAFALGLFVVYKDNTQLGVFLSFVGAVVAFAIAFYCWKAKAENLLKIKKQIPNLDTKLSDFSNLNSQ